MLHVALPPHISFQIEISSKKKSTLKVELVMTETYIQRMECVHELCNFKNSHASHHKKHVLYELLLRKLASSLCGIALYDIFTQSPKHTHNKPKPVNWEIVKQTC